MRRLLAVACLAVVSCGALQGSSGGGEFSDLVACIPPVSTPPSATMLAAMVDRADVVALVSVDKAERTYKGYFDAQGARRLTLRTLENVKGTAPGGFVIDDGRCPSFVGKEGESFIAFLDSDGLGYKAIGYPRSAIRAAPDHTLAQYMSDVRAIRSLDGEAKALFERHGWTVTGKLEIAEVTLPPLAEWPHAGREIRGGAPYMYEPLVEYALLSNEVGLDPRPYAGRTVERLSVWLETPPPGFIEYVKFGHVLIAERRIIAAWVSVQMPGGPAAFSARDRSTALAARSPKPFPPANRAPQGANIARMYGLANARSIAYKTGTGGNGEVTDPAKIHAIAAVLDETLPTTQATWPRQQPPTMYWLHFAFGDSTVSLEYDSADGTITVILDGFSAKAPAALGPLLADLR